MKENINHGEDVVAIVQGIIKGKHGRYAITTSEKINGSITFSLRKGVWQEKDDPEPGVYVVLSELHKKRNGWYACKARFFRPEDEEKQKPADTH